MSSSQLTNSYCSEGFFLKHQPGGTIPCPTFINPSINTDSWDVTLDEAVDFAALWTVQLCDSHK